MLVVWRNGEGWSCNDAHQWFGSGCCVQFGDKLLPEKSVSVVASIGVHNAKLELVPVPFTENHAFFIDLLHTEALSPSLYV